MKTINDLKILSYEIEIEKEFDLIITIENMRNTTGWWAIKSNDSVSLNKRTGKFDYEPMPSSRTKAYLKSHRFESVQEAIDCYNQVVEKIEKRYSKAVDKILSEHFESSGNPLAIDICVQVMDAVEKKYSHFEMACVLNLIKRKTTLQKT